MALSCGIIFQVEDETQSAEKQHHNENVTHKVSSKLYNLNFMQLKHLLHFDPYSYLHIFKSIQWFIFSNNSVYHFQLFTFYLSWIIKMIIKNKKLHLILFYFTMLFKIDKFATK